MGGKICMRHKDKTLLGIVNKLFLFKSLLTTPSNVLPLHLSYSNVGNTMEGYKIKSALPFKIFSTLMGIKFGLDCEKFEKR